MILHIDFETFSSCDLKARGLDNYAKHPTTGVHCMAYVFEDVCSSDGLCLWTPFDDPRDTEYEMRGYLADGGLVYAHNAAFELAIWNNIMVPRYGWPELKPGQVRCTMAMCYAMGLPGPLENAAPALGIAERKDSLGKRTMLQLCKEKEPGVFWAPEMAPGKFQILYDYCKQDVEVERALHHRLLELSPEELRVWALDYKINQRGVMVDLGSIQKAETLVREEKARLNEEMLRVTRGVVGSCSEVQVLVKWLKSEGVALEGAAKSDVIDALKIEDISGPARAALLLRQEAAKSSTAKLTAMVERAYADGRVRGLHQYHGANTGRWAGRGVQLQNVPRPRIKQAEIEDLIAHMDDKSYVDLFYGPTMAAVSDIVRGMIVAPEGCDLMAVDFSAIEARVLAWLADEAHVLETFRKGEDIYLSAAGRIYHISPHLVSKSQRQIGKVATLALGYGGGVGAFQQMAKGYGVRVGDGEAEEIKTAWREAHPATVSFWYALEDAAIRALRTGSVETVGKIAYRKKGSFLWCRLPSGRMICYPYPELRTVTTPWGAEKEALTYMTEVDDPKKAKTLDDPASFGKWKRISTYGGSLAENVTQAVARDLLADSMLRLDEQGLSIVMHVHDEVVLEVPSDWNPGLLKKVEAFMSVPPAWAQGLPLAAEGWRGKRYRK